MKEGEKGLIFCICQAIIQYSNTTRLCSLIIQIIPFETSFSRGFFYRYFLLQEVVGRIRKLNDKQKLFCREYLKDASGTQAAIRAGYSEKTADRIGSALLSKIEIKNRINELSRPLVAEVFERVKIDKEWVVNQAVRIVKACGQMLTLRNKQGEALLDDEGKPIKQPVNPKAVNASLSLIADVLAMKTTTQLNVEMSPKQLLEMVEARQALTTSHTEPPVLTGEDTLYLPSEGKNDG